MGAAIEAAISLSPEQRASRTAPDLAFVRRNTASVWAGRILCDVRLASRADGLTPTLTLTLALALTLTLTPTPTLTLTLTLTRPTAPSCASS